MTTLKQLLKEKKPNPTSLAVYLDALPIDEQVAQIRTLSPGLVKKLYEITAVNEPCTLDDIVPNDVESGVEVRHKGINSLPVSRLFEKRFCRSPEQDTHFWGYNQQPLMWLTGPGFFVVNEPKEEPLFIDYRSVPAEKLNTWPEIHPNEKGVSKLVYAGMQDYMRKVSSRVTVGEACKKGKSLGQYFALVRLEAGDDETPLP